MKTSLFVESNAIPSFATVAATIQTANWALFLAINAIMYKNRAHATPEGRIQETVDYFGISEVPSTSGYESLPRSPAEKMVEAWVHLVDVAKAAARAAECGKALEKLNTPAQVAAKFGTGEMKPVDPADVPGLDEQVLASLQEGSKKELDRSNTRVQANAAEAAKEVDLLFRSLRGNAQVDLYPHEVSRFISKFADQLRNGLNFGLRSGFYSKGGKVDPRRAGELMIETNVLKVAEATRTYLETVGCADDTPDMDAEHA